MDARESFIVRFLGGEDKKFIIPVYQRPYSWKKNNCVQLLNDLKSLYQNKYESHFFGSIVYVEEDVGGCNEYIIIDGQQRLTTVSILLLAIRNYLRNNPNFETVINVDKITKSYLTDEYANDEIKDPFIKSLNYFWQQEYRIAIPANNNKEKIFYIGKLSGFVCKTRSLYTLNQML